MNSRFSMSQSLAWVALPMSSFFSIKQAMLLLIRRESLLAHKGAPVRPLGLAVLLLFVHGPGCGGLSCTCALRLDPAFIKLSELLIDALIIKAILVNACIKGLARTPPACLAGRRSLHGLSAKSTQSSSSPAP